MWLYCNNRYDIFNEINARIQALATYIQHLVQEANE